MLVSSLILALTILSGPGLLGGPAVAASAPGPAVAASAPGGTAPKLFLGYWAKWGENQRPEASLSQNMSRIDLFSPYWYTLRSDGSLSGREADREALTATVQRNGRKVIPLINKTASDAPLLEASIRQAAVENIYRVLVDNHYDGVNIDFEGLPPSSKDGLTAFMTELAAKLRPADLLVTMAVPAKWSADDSINDFSACFDYSALGRLVDYLVIMTYDQHAGWSGPGPVAGLDWTEDTVRYATTVVPADKILLGLAGYGYDWSETGEISEVEAWSVPDAAAGHGVDVQWDSVTQTPHFTYWNSSGRHDVWYEDSRSVDFKVSLMWEYDLAGVALWALGQEDARFWRVMDGTAGASGGLGPASAPGSLEPWGSGGSAPGGIEPKGGNASAPGAGSGSDSSTRSSDPVQVTHPDDSDDPGQGAAPPRVGEIRRLIAADGPARTA
jgi:spore germination protein YaaH